MRILFVGDVIGSPGRKALREALPRVIDERRIDFTVVNVENAAGGFGVTREIYDELDRLPIDVMTSGNHIWDKKEFIPELDHLPKILRPVNYPPGVPGRGWGVFETAAGIPVGVLNVMGQVYMPNVDSPFRAIDAILDVPDRPRVVVVDIHAEVTSEKNALGWYLDGRASAVAGTHTHIPTADARILPKGTGYVTDAGGTGAWEGVIGFKADKVIERFLTQMPRPFEVAKRDVRLSSVLFTVDEESGRATEVERVDVRVG